MQLKQANILEARQTLAKNAALSARKVRKQGITFAKYLFANRWGLIPLIGALLIMAIARNVNELPADCAAVYRGADARQANWVLCDIQPNPIAQVLSASAAKIKSNGPALSGEMASSLAQLKDMQDAEKPPVADVALGLREASARLLWTGSYGALEAVALFVSIGAIWLTIQSLLQQSAVLTGDGSPWSYIFWFLLIAASGALVLFFIFLSIFSGLFGVTGASPDTLADIISRPDKVIADDQIMNWLTTYETALPSQIAHALRLLAFGLVLLLLVVISVLYQAPDDEAFRMSGDLAEPQNARYRRQLGRSFGRLTFATYMGAALLAATVMEVSARYSWPIAMLPPNMTELIEPLKAFAQEFAMRIGLAFSALLAIIYFPSMAILRQRGRDYFRARNPNASLKDQEDFLEGESLAIKFSANYKQLLALLAPVGVATIDQLISSLPS